MGFICNLDGGDDIMTMNIIKNYVIKSAFHTHEYDYKGRNLASTAVILYHSGVGYSPSLSIIYSCY